MRIDYTLMVNQHAAKRIVEEFNLTVKELFWLQACAWYLNKKNYFPSASALRAFSVSKAHDEIYKNLILLENKGCLEKVRVGQKFKRGFNSTYNVTWLGTKIIKKYDLIVIEVSKQLLIDLDTPLLLNEIRSGL